VPKLLVSSVKGRDKDKERHLRFWTSARYQGNMLRSLREVQGDDSVIGFYVAASFGAFYTHSLVDLQAGHQERLRQGGIVVVHGRCFNLQSLHLS
jgi:hypothetical protein